MSKEKKETVGLVRELPSFEFLLNLPDIKPPDAPFYRRPKWTGEIVLNGQTIKAELTSTCFSRDLNPGRSGFSKDLCFRLETNTQVESWSIQENERYLYLDFRGMRAPSLLKSHKIFAKGGLAARIVFRNCKKRVERTFASQVDFGYGQTYLGENSPFESVPEMIDCLVNLTQAIKDSITSQNSSV